MRLFFAPLSRARMRPWWDSPLMQLFGAGGLAARIVAEHCGGFFIPHAYANDRDHCPW